MDDTINENGATFITVMNEKIQKNQHRDTINKYSTARFLNFFSILNHNYYKNCNTNDGINLTLYHDNVSQPKDEIMNPWFFNDLQLSRDYVIYQKQYFSILQHIPYIIVGLSYMYINTSFTFGTDSSAYYLFTTSLILYAICVCTLFIYMWAQLAISHKWYNDENDPKGKMRARCQYIVVTWLWGRIEDIVMLSAIVGASLVLIGRVLNGQCPTDTAINTLRSVQTCNPFANAGGIPFDQVMFLYAASFGCHMLMAGVTVNSLVLIWIVIIGAVTFSVFYVNSNILIFVVLLAAHFVTMSFEFERRMRISFLQTRLISETKRREFEYKVDTLNKDHELNLMAVSKDNEKKLMEAETFQLRGLMGNVAHDLKTPLQSITVELELMKSEVKEFLSAETGGSIGNEVCRRFESTMNSIFESLDGTCNFMTMAINRSQDYMKASSNIALVPHNQTFHLMKVISTAAGYIQSTQPGRILVIDPLPSDLCTHIISDKQWLCENLMCYISNAVKYSEKGATVNISANLDLTETPDSVANTQPMLRFMVEDTGIGISEEMRSKLFQPFKQAQRMTGGTGLGLYSLAMRLEALGGSCGVEGRRDGKQGSMFWFKIPYRPDESMASSVECSAQDNVNSSKSDDPTKVLPNDESPNTDDITANKLSFLVVDDTGSILKMLDRVLKKKGHAVMTAENGNLSLQLLKKSYETGEFFDVVLTDLQMPVMDGLESIKRFRDFESEFCSLDGHSRRRQLVIGMSANSDAQSRQNALDTGMDNFVAKPFKYEHLQTVLPTHLLNQCSF